MIICGDCLEVMRGMEANSVDAIVTDPPYGLEFMGKEWDSFRGSNSGIQKSGFEKLGQHGTPSFSPNRRNQKCPICGKWAYDYPGRKCDCGGWKQPAQLRYSRAFEEWSTKWTAEALRVAKPGAFLIAAGGQRTHHRLMVALEDAGWEIRDVMMHVFGSGFPKSHNVSKVIRAMPACRCGVAKVAGQGGIIDALAPSGLVGAGVGTEAGSMPLAGCSANGADRHGAKPRGGSGGRQGKMMGGVEMLGGQDDPVVLGLLDVAGMAEGDKVPVHVGVVEPQPEALRDDVMANEIGGRITAKATAIAGDNPLGNNRPFSALVSPRPVSPGRIAGAAESGAVVNGHTGSGTIDGLGNLAPDRLAANPTSESVHQGNDTTGRRVCQACGGVIQENIPDGFGTALKPAYEPWILCRKPLEGTVAENFLKWGTGAINVDGCRVDGPKGNGVWGSSNKACQDGRIFNASPSGEEYRSEQNHRGRWPANLLHDGSEEVLALFPNSGNGAGSPTVKKRQRNKGWCNSSPGEGVDAIDNFGDSGSAARFFYCAKASRKEREMGCEGMPVHIQKLPGKSTGFTPSTGEITNGYTGECRNHHPTVKPLALMRYLCRLVTPPNGLVLDPFMGSGTTLIAAGQEGFRAVGIELNAEYCEIAKKRIYGTLGEMEAAHV